MLYISKYGMMHYSRTSYKTKLNPQKGHVRNHKPSSLLMILGVLTLRVNAHTYIVPRNVKLRFMVVVVNILCREVVFFQFVLYQRIHCIYCVVPTKICLVVTHNNYKIYTHAHLLCVITAYYCSIL